MLTFRGNDLKQGIRRFYEEEFSVAFVGKQVMPWRVEEGRSPCATAA